MAKRDWLLLVLRVLTGILLVPATCLLLLAVVTWLSGDGIADAAPWWVFFAFLAALLGLPGLLFLLLARWRAARGSGPYELQVGGGSPTTLSFDAVIFAVPAPAVPALCPDLPKSFQEELRNITYAPSIVAAFTLEKRYPGASMINNVLRQDLKTVGTVVFDHHKSPDHVPPGKGLVTVILSEAGSRGLYSAPDDSIVGAVRLELDGLFPGLPETISNTRVYRWEYGAIQLGPGRVSRTHTLRKALEEQFDDLFIAGDGLYKSSLEISHNTGVKAANHVLKKLGRAS